jgi:hypothetical protein
MTYTPDQLSEWKAAMESENMGIVLNAMSAIVQTGDKSLVYLLQNAGAGLRASVRQMKIIKLNEDEPALDIEGFRNKCIQDLTGNSNLDDVSKTSATGSTNSGQRKIFISYNHRDKEWATRLALELGQLPGVDVFIDHWEMSAGQSLLDRIEEGIDQSSFLVVLLSSHSVESKWVRTELQYAFFKEQEEGRTWIIPVVIEDCKLPIHVAGRLYVDMKSDSTWEQSFQQLVNVICGRKPFSKLVSEYLKREKDNSPYTDKAKQAGRRLLLELAKYREMDVEENQRWMLWTLFHKLLKQYKCTIKMGHQNGSPEDTMSFIFIDRWNAQYCSVVLKADEFRRGLWSGEFDPINGCELKSKHLEFLGDIGRLSLNPRYNSHTAVNPFLDSCAKAMKPILRALESEMKHFDEGGRLAFLYDLEKIVHPATNRNIKVVVGSASESQCCAPLYRFRDDCAQPSEEWAVYELFDPFFGALKYTSVCPNHLQYFLAQDVDLMSAETEVSLGLA